ncbi:Glucosaminyl phosphatidylinositol (GlcN-PI) nositol acylation protein, partial [Tulasnella sp. 403]
MLLTVICILAVDFPVFPRALAKCESWGISVMDLGVGSFVFSQGLVSAIPFLKTPPTGMTTTALKRVLSATRKVLPVLALGLIRVVLVKGTEYPEHVSEYGVHWNFFITLALLPVGSAYLQPYLYKMPVSLLGLFITAAHQFSLSYSGLQSWALGDDRKGLLSQNKEGIVSLPGYLAIHMLGFAIGILILPPSPSHFRRRYQAPRHDSWKSSIALSNRRQLDKTVIELGAYVV